MKSAIEVLDAFENIRRAQHGGKYAPHKPLLILTALARVQRGERRLVAFAEIEGTMKKLLAEFGSTNAVNTRHLPFWHLATDGNGAIWQLRGPRDLINRPPGVAPTLRELRRDQVEGGFPIEIDDALRITPGLLQAVASRVLDASFPSTLHADIAAAVGLDLAGSEVREVAPDPSYPPPSQRRRRDPGFRERVLLAYEYRCCVCGFDLRIGHIPAGLEAAHIQWHQFGGPDIEPNGLSLCALHHKLFDLGAFTIEPTELRVLFSEHAISGKRGMTGELQHHGRVIHKPERSELWPAAQFLRWNSEGPFKKPSRPVPTALRSPGR